MHQDKLLEELRLLAEKSGEEYRTRECIEREMARLKGYRRERIGQSLVYSHLPFEDRPVVAIRADMDAVLTDEGNYEHRCGHHGHTAILLRFAREMQDSDRNFILLFQSAEETAGGAMELIEGGFFERYQPALILGFHNFPGFRENHLMLRPGAMNHSVIGFACTLSGRASHAANPEDGSSPAYALARLVNELETLGNGEIMVSITHMRLGEYQFGTSSGQAVLLGTIRSLDDPSIGEGLRRLEESLERITTRYGIEGELKTHEYFKGIINDERMVDEIRGFCQERGYPVWEMDAPFRAGEDFGFYLEKVPGCFLGIGAGVDHSPLHTEEYRFNENNLPFMAKLLHDLVEDGRLLEI